MLDLSEECSASNTAFIFYADSLVLSHSGFKCYIIGFLPFHNIVGSQVFSYSYKFVSVGKYNNVDVVCLYLTENLSLQLMFPEQLEGGLE